MNSTHFLVKLSFTYLSHCANILKLIVPLNILSFLFNDFLFFNTSISLGTRFQHELTYNRNKNVSSLINSVISI